MNYYLSKELKNDPDYIKKYPIDEFIKRYPSPYAEVMEKGKKVIYKNLLYEDYIKEKNNNKN